MYYHEPITSLRLRLSEIEAIDYRLGFGRCKLWLVSESSHWTVARWPLLCILLPS